MKTTSKPITEHMGEAVTGRSVQTCSTSTGTRVPTMDREDWNRRYAAEAFIWTVDANRFLVEEVRNLAPGRALDLAAGEGRNAVWLAEQGWTVQAVDLSDVAVEKGKRLAAARGVSDKIEFRQADLRTYEPEENRFDLVVLVYLQIPQADLVPILIRAAKAVAPGGTFLLVAHDSTNLKHGYGGPQHSALLYTAEQVVAALGNELEIEKAGCVDRPVQTNAGIQGAKDCLVRAKSPFLAHFTNE
ncbi:MAG: class I SAM-dependent methyltransferase [Pseudomonadota bacterium]